MNKIKQIMEKHDLTEHQVTKFTGNPSRTDTLRLVAEGKRDITSVNLNLLTSYARGLGLRLQDILNDYDIDGSTTQVKSINRYIDKLKRFGTVVQEFDNGGFVVAVKTDYDNFKQKDNFEFLNPQVTHSEQTTNAIYLLNNLYLNSLWDKEKDKNKTLAKIFPSLNKRTKSYIIYSPLELGGDLKLVADVFNKDEQFVFSELIGCEWIDTDDNQSICYYKNHSQKSISPSEVNNIEKEEISEVEFYKALGLQLPKYNIVEQ